MIIPLIFIQRNCFFCFDLSSIGCGHVGLLFIKEDDEQVSFMTYMTCISATYADLGHDVTYTDCQTQNGTAHGPFCCCHF